jgi:subtilisin family serine protease
MGKIVLGLCLLITISFATLVDTPDNIYLRNRIIVELKPAAQDITVRSVNGTVTTGYVAFDALLNRYNTKAMIREFPAEKPSWESGSKVDISRYYIVYFQDNVNLENALTEFAANPLVNHAEPDSICPVDVVPNDPYWNFLWHLQQGQDHDIDAPEAWDVEEGSTDTILAICDTGVDYEHPDLINKIWHNAGEIESNGIDDDGNGYIDDTIGWDWVTGAYNIYPGEDGQTPDNDPMDFFGHGTHCAGIAGAEVNNAEGVAGIDWNGKIMCLRAGYAGSDGNGYLLMSACAQSINYATYFGATAVNCSWGNNNTGGLGAAVDNAVAAGVLISVAAGNSNSQSPTYLSQRGDCLSVAATDSNDVRASFSNYGSWIDVSAPGVGIFSTYRQHLGEHTYTTMSGTSMAAPCCVGVAGLLKAQDPSRYCVEIKELLKTWADPIDSLNPGFEGLLGTGRINANNSLLQLTGVNIVDFAASNDAPARINVRWNAEEAAAFNLYRRNGAVGTFKRGTDPKTAGFVRINQRPIAGSSSCLYTDKDVTQGKTYTYIVEAIDTQGHSVYAGPAMGEATGQMYSLALKGIWPNPVRASGTIHYTAAGIAGSMVPVRLDVYDLSGRLVKTLVDGNVTVGENEASLDVNTASMAAGVYTVRLASQGQAKTSRIVVSH